MNVREEPSASDAVRAEVGRRIREQRLAKKLSQAKFGALLRNANGKAVTDSHVSKWERGINLPDRRYWQQIEDALGIRFGDLLPSEGTDTALAVAEETADRLTALIRVLGMEDAVEAAVRGDRKRKLFKIDSTPPPEEDREAEEIEQAVAEADQQEEKKPPKKRGAPKRGKGAPRSSRRRGSNGTQG